MTFYTKWWYNHTNDTNGIYSRYSEVILRTFSGAGESRLRGVGDEWSWVHLIDQVIWRSQLIRLRFHVTSLASWSCRWTTHQHQSTRLYCSRQTTCYHRAPAYAGRHVSAIWLRVGEVEQEERVSVCSSWGWVTSKSRLHVTIKQRAHRSDSKRTDVRPPTQFPY